MKSKKIGNTYIIRLDKGEELVDGLEKFCMDEKIKLGTIQGIGATNDVTVGYFDTKKKEYFSKRFEGDFEIASLSGNITTMDGKIYLHLHITFGDKEFGSHSGHLNQAMISATFEGVITAVEGEVCREHNKKIGLNLLKL